MRSFVTTERQAAVFGLFSKEANKVDFAEISLANFSSRGMLISEDLQNFKARGGK